MATDLQRQMTEHILTQGEQVGCDVVLCLDGGTVSEIHNWLGAAVNVLPQVDGDLGRRMAHFFDWGFTRGYRRIVLVGADCPALDAPLLQSGFTALSSCDLVLGPSLDGGYYLIGMKDRLQEVFTGISWGSSQVLSETMVVAAGRKVEQLPILRDVDLPSDLGHLPSFLRVEGF